MFATPRRPNRTALRSLALRLAAQQEELRGCTTAAQTRCVLESVLDTRRQIAEAGGVA